MVWGQQAKPGPQPIPYSRGNDYKYMYLSGVKAPRTDDMKDSCVFVSGGGGPLPAATYIHTAIVLVEPWE